MTNFIVMVWMRVRWMEWVLKGVSMCMCSHSNEWMDDISWTLGSRVRWTEEEFGCVSARKGQIARHYG